MDLLKFQNDLKIKKEQGVGQIFDPIRKKWCIFTPEEVVRQLVILYLIIEKNYPKNRIAVERQVLINGTKRRFDILVYRTDLSPLLLVECKAPKVVISQQAFDQTARYNIGLRVDFLVVTNGTTTFCCRLDNVTNDYVYLSEVPNYEA